MSKPTLLLAGLLAAAAVGGGAYFALQRGDGHEKDQRPAGRRVGRGGRADDLESRAGGGLGGLGLPKERRAGHRRWIPHG